jgi:hypothetical protein
MLAIALNMHTYYHIVIVKFANFLHIMHSSPEPLVVWDCNIHYIM